MTTFGTMGGARRVAGMRSFGLRVRPSGFWAYGRDLGPMAGWRGYAPVRVAMRCVWL